MLRLLSYRSLCSRKFISALCVLSIALSLSLFLVVEKVRDGVENGFTNTISQADLIVGARSSSLQLLLYTVFHMGSPTNNIRYSSFEKIKAHPLVKWVIPISLGDSYKGHRVVATNESFFNHYQFYGDRHLKMKEGKWVSDIYDVVIGQTVAKKQGLKLGDQMTLSHGISDAAVLEHEKSPFNIVGILSQTGTPLDKSVFITLYGMEAMHKGWETGAPSYDKEIDYQSFTREDLTTTQLTSFILKSKNRFGLLHLSSWINKFEAEPLTATIPGMALNELWSMLDRLESAFVGISFFVIVIGFLSILISLYMSLSQRKKEMAILRSIGVSPLKITALFLSEAFLLSIFGGVLGFSLQYLLIYLLAPILEVHYSLPLSISTPSMREIYVTIFFVFCGPIAGLVPAIKAYQSSLNEGLSS